MRAKKGRENAIFAFLDWKARAGWAGALQKARKTRAFSHFWSFWAKNASLQNCS